MNRRGALYVFTLTVLVVLAVILGHLAGKVIKARENERIDARIKQGLDLVHEIVHKN